MTTRTNSSTRASALNSESKDSDSESDYKNIKLLNGFFTEAFQITSDEEDSDHSLSLNSSSRYILSTTVTDDTNTLSFTLTNLNNVYRLSFTFASLKEYKNKFGFKANWKEFFQLYRESLIVNDAQNSLVTVNNNDKNKNNNLKLLVTLQVNTIDLHAELELIKIGQLFQITTVKNTRASHSSASANNNTKLNGKKRKMLVEEDEEEFPDISFLDETNNNNNKTNKTNNINSHDSNNNNSNASSVEHLSAIINDLVFGLYNSHHQLLSSSTKNNSSNNSNSVNSSSNSMINTENELKEKKIISLQSRIDSLEKENLFLKQNNSSQNSSQSQSNEAINSRDQRQRKQKEGRSIINPGQKRRTQKGIHFGET